MPRKGENVYKRKDGRWEGRYIKARTATGKAVYGYVYAHTYRDVKQKLSICPIETFPSVPLSVSAPEPVPSVGALADMWLQSIRPQIKDSTHIKYRNLLQKYILPEFQEKNVKDLTYDCIEAFIHALLVSGGAKKQGLSPKTTSDIIALMRAMIRYAVHHGAVVPCMGAGISVKQNPKELTIFTVYEQTKLQRYLTEHMNHKSFGLLLCLFTGIRVGEVCALKWEDISLNEKTMYVHGTMQRLQCENDPNRKTKITITSPKSRCSIRTIPLPDFIVDIIKTDFAKQCGYVLTGSEQKFVEPRTMQNYFKRVLKDCAINAVNYHALRHTFATRCVEQGFDVKCLSEILGHANVNITMNRYVHPSMEAKRENMNLLSNLFTVR